MKTKPHVKRGQTKLFVTLIILLAVGVQAHAQGIVYYDPMDVSVNAIIVAQSDAVIDVDRDGSTDFRLVYSSSAFSIVPTNGNAVLTSTDPPNRYGTAGALANGAEVSSALPPGQQFDPGRPYYFGNQLLGVTGPTLGVISEANGGRVMGPFAGIEAFLGFRISKPDGDHYGWMRVDMIRGYGGRVVNVSEWAYSTVPGQSINAGVVPEPSTWALIGIGAVAFCFARRKQQALRAS